jgi:hypothetical protein
MARAYFGLIESSLGLDAIQSFWVYSAILFAASLVLLGLTAWAFVRWCWPFRPYQSRALANVVGLIGLVWYLLLVSTVLMLFFQRAGDNYVYVIAALVLFILAISPIYIVHMRARRLIHGA